ncbi:MAG: iron-sulfur cluster assembly scaffold protein [Myxococcota bacterium]
MDEAKALYKKRILERSRDRARTGPLEDADGAAIAINSLCGDRITVAVRRTPNGDLDVVRYVARGCAIAKASAAIMAELIEGAAPEIAAHLAEQLENHLRDGTAWGPEVPAELKLLGDVHPFTSRHRCATLPWEALTEALRPPPPNGTED